MMTGGIVADERPATAVPRGEAVTFPGGLTISNYVMPNGTRAYCIEIQLGEPSGYMSEAGRVREMPGRSGKFHSWGDVNGMRQINYLMDGPGQCKDAWTAAAVQLTIWRMRENFKAGNPFLNAKIDTLQRSAKGRALIAASDALTTEARREAKAPGSPQKVTGKLVIAPDPAGKAGKYRVAYPAGTRDLSVRGGVFLRTGTATVDVADTGASARYVQAAPGARKIEVTGSWRTQGTRGWEPIIDIYNTSTASGAVGQRLAVATGRSNGTHARGRFDTVARTIPPPFADPDAASQAQASAEIGGTMRDTLIVTEMQDTRARIWPDAVADFTAYLEPVAGSVKYGPDWEPLLGEPHMVQARDPETQELLWTELPGRGPIPGGSGASDDTGDSVERDDGAPGGAVGDEGGDASVRTGDGSPPRREPLMEERRDPLVWSAEEIANMSAAQRCVAQPVYREGGIVVSRVGEYHTKPVTVRSAGTVNWVERIRSGGRTVHQGKCGAANERTAIEQPGVTTAAVPSVMLGEVVTDVATVTGRFAPNASYSLRFEAYRAAESEVGEPLCAPGNRIFRSERLPVEGPGEVTSPGFVARWEHGTQIWWVETLYWETPAGPKALHRGACGLETETSVVGRPEVSTLAPETAVVGDRIGDTAMVTGDVKSSSDARWELTFAAYRGPTASHETPGSEVVGQALEPAELDDNPGKADSPGKKSLNEDQNNEVPLCTPENLLFETAATPVTGPGKYRSEEHTVPFDWIGTVWWVETLWLIEGEERIPVSVGECGAVDEATVISGPELSTRASAVAAIGEAMEDVAEITGELSQRDGVSHELVFEGYRGVASEGATSAALCVPENEIFKTDPIAITQAGEYTSSEVTALPEYGDTVWWVAVLLQRSDGNVVELARGTCGDPSETTTIQPPRVRTESAGTVTLGEELYDAAIVEGRLGKRAGVSFRVTFTAYAEGADGVLACVPDRVIESLSDFEGVPVSGPGRYTSKRTVTTAEHVGAGGFVETLLMRENDQDYIVHVGECGAASERFTVSAIPPVETRPESPDRPALPPAPLAMTGGAVILPALLGAGLLLLLGLAIGWGVIVRRESQRKEE
ncbi:hypothetical protein EDF62_3406 [Leucobacter luti]|uniref:Uncharacterized protein n=1 Tax=Leucobacter luti TaxID=340320 RepID=A0A4R6RR81_9MICO|nr:hypothetical protein [Leucobacter luti]TDP89323.1 hypothetical protein EDF62_3406 [Leucobacter luti]